ncbi:MAG: serpin family protein [Pseudomonadota bacterium]
MTRKNKIIASVSVLAAAMFAAGCGGAGSSASATPEAPQLLAQSSLVRSSAVHVTNPDVSAADLDAVVAGNNDFAAKALAQFGANPDENLVFSPYSIGEAISMAAAGAKGDTLSGIERALGLALPQERLNPALNKAALLLQQKTMGQVDQMVQQPSLNMVNTIWGQRGYPFQPAYLDTLASQFDAGMRVLDFHGAPQAARATINDFIDAQTQGRIKDLLADGAITEDTRAVLTNAIWFKANWAVAFDPGASKDKAFVPRSGNAAMVPFMNRTGGMAGVQTSAYQAVELDYAGNRMSMMVIMPAPGSYDSFVGTLDAQKLASIARSLQPQLVELALPKFTFSSTPAPKAVLQARGMLAAFDPKLADFSGIDGEHDLFISDIVHKAFIGVDEIGTEAAAATAVVMVTSLSVSMGTPPQPLRLNFDHPFVFAIRDKETGLVVFMGRVVKL